MKKTTIMILLIMAICSQNLTVFAHPGRLDSSGGHNDNINGGYHYHNGNGSSSGSTYTKPKPKKIYPSSVYVKKPSRKIYPGSSMKLSKTVYPYNASNKKVSWKSSNNKILKISFSGKIKALRAGKVTITARTSNGKTSKISLRVLPIKAKSIKFINSIVSLQVGGKSKLKCSISPKKTTNKTINWESDNSDCLIVDKKGNIEALAEGEAIITAKTSNGKKAKLKIQIENNDVKESPEITEELADGDYTTEETIVETKEPTAEQTQSENEKSNDTGNTFLGIIVIAVILGVVFLRKKK